MIKRIIQQRNISPRLCSMLREIVDLKQVNDLVFPGLTSTSFTLHQGKQFISHRDSLYVLLLWSSYLVWGLACSIWSRINILHLNLNYFHFLCVQQNNWIPSSNKQDNKSDKKVYKEAEQDKQKEKSKKLLSNKDSNRKQFDSSVLVRDKNQTVKVFYPRNNKVINKL